MKVFQVALSHMNCQSRSGLTQGIHQCHAPTDTRQYSEVSQASALSFKAQLQQVA